MNKYLIKLDTESWAGMDDEAAEEIKANTAGEAWCERVDGFRGYYLYATSLNALAAAYCRICATNTLKEAMEQGDPSHDLGTAAGVWAEFAEYYNIVK